MEDPHVTREPSGVNVLVGPLQGEDLAEADRIFRVAFGTFLGLPNPIEFAETWRYGIALGRNRIGRTGSVSLRTR
jgi:hypothetical protein